MPQIQISRDYFHRVVKNDYSDYQEAIVREFLQNSVDAGADNVHFNFDMSNYKLEVIDDGCGMDRTVLEEKLLCLGGTFKGEGDSIGGFGKAKEVLFFCWDGYMIETGNLRVHGKGSEYQIDEMPINVKGTRCVIHLGGEHETREIREKAYVFLNTCGPSAKMHVDGNEISPLKVFRSRRKTDWGKMYVRDVNYNRCLVRKSGVTMFNRYVSYNEGTVVFELSGHPTEYLVANRDSLKSTYGRELDTFIDALGKNKRLAELQTKDLVEYYRSDKQIAIKDLEDDDTTKVFAQAIDLGIVEESDTLEVAVAKMRAAVQDEQVCDSVRLDYKDVLLKQLLDDFWGYDCFVVYKDGKKPSFKLKSNKAKKLFTAWTRIVEQLAEDIVHNPDFFGSDVYSKRILDKVKSNKLVTGFVFDETVKGMMKTVGEDKTAILLNPVKYRLTNRWHITLWHLITVAVHEMAHFVSSYHDEVFTCAESAIWDLIYSSPEIERKYNSLTAVLR